MFPCWALSATGEVTWVFTTIPGATSSVQEACGLGIGRPLPASGISTRHCRQAPTGSSSGWSQNRGISVPISSAARITRVPFGTLTSTSSMVSVTVLSRSRIAPEADVVVAFRETERRVSLIVPPIVGARFSTLAGARLVRQSCARSGRVAHEDRAALVREELPGRGVHTGLELVGEELDGGTDR